jgi:hypothetical protein
MRRLRLKDEGIRGVPDELEAAPQLPGASGLSSNTPRSDQAVTNRSRPGAKLVTSFVASASASPYLPDPQGLVSRSADRPRTS